MFPETLLILFALFELSLFKEGPRDKRQLIYKVLNKAEWTELADSAGRYSSVAWELHAQKTCPISLL